MARIILTFEELPLVSDKEGFGACLMQEVTATIYYSREGEWNVDHREPMYSPSWNHKKACSGKSFRIEPGNPLWSLIADAIEETQAEYVWGEINAERLCAYDDAADEDRADAALCNRVAA